MRFTVCCLILFALWLSVAPITAQEISPSDRAKLEEAEHTADLFIERFRQTLDFAVVWQEFKSENAKCLSDLYHQDIFLKVSGGEHPEMSDELLERGYVAFMNFYYMGNAFALSRFSIARMGEIDDKKYMKLLPREVSAKMKKLKYIKENGKTPANVKELEECIAELNLLTGIYRKHLPPDVMRNATWKENLKYFALHSHPPLQDVLDGDGVCVPKTAKKYYVKRGVFILTFAEERGQMKLIETGIG